jgi:hypothetical protein
MMTMIDNEDEGVVLSDEEFVYLESPYDDNDEEVDTDDQNEFEDEGV